MAQQENPLTPSRKPAAVVVAILAITAAAFSVGAQPQGQPGAAQTSPSAGAPINFNLVAIDPAHGGSESGATVGDNVPEKQVTLSLAGRLQAALTQAGFTVMATRTGDPAEPITTDQRAEMANRLHPGACLVLHATQTGSGVHLYTSTLEAASDDQDADSSFGFVPTPWEAAQATYVDKSLSLQSALAGALDKSHLPTLTGKAPLRPLNNLMCPAVAIELAPLPAGGAGATPVTDADYQQQAATTLANALKLWRDQAESAADESTGDRAAAQAIAAAEAAGRSAAASRAARRAQGTP